MRKFLLTLGGFYHVYTKSIASFTIFNNPEDFSRMKDILLFSRSSDFKVQLSWLLKAKDTEIDACRVASQGSRKRVRMIAYCIMPTHLHLFLEQKEQNGISVFMNHVLISYTRYFNIKHNRKGPLWESRFKNSLVVSDEYALHLTRYIHLNPSTAGLVGDPEEWDYSSYREYLKARKAEDCLCEFSDIFEIKTEDYKKFVLNRKDYQRQLAQIKELVLEPVSDCGSRGGGVL